MWQRRATVAVLMGCLVSLAGGRPAAAESDSKTIRVSATILPRLELSVTPETGQVLAFGTIEQPAFGRTIDRAVRVNVHTFSNLGRPYHITQLVRHLLTNDEGTTIPAEQFQVLTPGASLGTLGAPHLTPMAPDVPTTLYISNGRGKSDAFLADYTLTVTPTTPAGQFQTEIVYTVLSL